MKLKKGTSLQNGEYSIEKTLGQGGFGITYLAHQRSLDRKVAIKEFFMADNCQRDEAGSCRMIVPTKNNQEYVAKAKEKFLREARMTAALQHPNVVTIFAVFEENDTIYYVMEYLQGGSLQELAENNALPEKMALYYIRQIGSALQYMHSNSQTHLDVKPGNIMLKDEVTAVLIDFGLTKQFDYDGHQLTSTRRAYTPCYAPLEQQSGVKEFFPTIDIYALGATLYFLLTGKNPPMADEVFNDGLPPLPSHISESTRKAVEKAMQPKAKERPATMQDFIDMLPMASAADISPRPKRTVAPAPKTKPGNSDNSHNEARPNNSGNDTFVIDKGKSSKKRTDVSAVNKKYLFMALGCMLLASVVWLIAKSSIFGDTQPTMSLDEAIRSNNGEQLQLYADIDSTGAFCPLARYYFMEDNDSKARKYATKALEAGRDTIAASELMLDVEGCSPYVAGMAIDKIIDNLPQDANLLIDELVKAVGQADKVNDKAKSLGLNYEYSHNRLDKLVDEHYRKWVKAGDTSPIPEVKRNCYNTALRLKPDGSEALKGLENL